MMIRYYLQAASENGFSSHPEVVMQELGFKLIKSLPETISDLWFFEVENTDRVPRWLNVVDENRVKELPEWQCAYDYQK
jgi:DNA-binding XRE family transcriptional regulator